MLWVRFEKDGEQGFGVLDDGRIAVHRGDMFDGPEATGEDIARAEVRLLIPCVPSKMICLWNNYHALAAKMDVPLPDSPLFFLKAPNAFLAHGETVRRPKSYDGPVVYEGELGIIIAKRASEVSPEQANGHIFGFTCVNDVTAGKIISENPTFAQWTRSKSFDTFGVFGPAIATGLDPAALSVKTVLNGDERQNYPVSDMVFQPAELVSRLSHDMTLEAGDVIACGTSIGVGSMKQPENEVSVTIEGIGILENRFVQ